MFFAGKPAAFALYEAFARKLLTRIPGAGIRVQKTQIAFLDPKIFACVSFAKVRKAKECPPAYIVITFGLHTQAQSPRIDVSTEPYPGRWTHHVLIEHTGEIDDELMGWVQEAHRFAQVK